MRKLAMAASVIFTLLLGPVAFGADPVTTIQLQDSKGQGLPNVVLQAFGSSGTQLRVKTDANGLATLPALRGSGSLEINHCEQAAESIALQIFDLNYGPNGGNFLIKLPPRIDNIIYELRTSDGVKIRQFEEVAYSFAATANTYVRDFGTFETPLGVAELSSCGSPWSGPDTLRVAPFTSSEADPLILVEEQITGGLTVREYNVRDFTPGEARKIVVDNFRYLDVQNANLSIFQGQPFRILGSVRGVDSGSDLVARDTFVVACGKKSSPTDTTSFNSSTIRKAGNTIVQEVTINSAGVSRCLLSGSSRDPISSFGFDIRVKSNSEFTRATQKKYKSCAALNLIFEGGLAKSKAAQQANVKSRKPASVSASGYKLNASLDRDKDGIACEN